MSHRYKLFKRLDKPVHGCLVKIVREGYLGNMPYKRMAIDSNLDELIKKQLIVVETGKFLIDGIIYPFVFLPTQLGYEVITGEEAPSKIELPDSLKQYRKSELNNESDLKYVENKEKTADAFTLEYSADTASRMMKDEEDEDYPYKLAQISTEVHYSEEDVEKYLDITDDDFMVRVLWIFDTKINPKQKQLKDILPSLVFNTKMDSWDFIRANHLDTLLKFELSFTNYVEEEDWCTKVFEYLKKHFPEGRNIAA